MSILTDELSDAVANLCWHYQGQQLKNNMEAPCICHALKDMVYLTRREIAKEIEQVMCDTPNHGDAYQDMKHEVADWAFKEAIRIARGEPSEDKY